MTIDKTNDGSDKGLQKSEASDRLGKSESIGDEKQNDLLEQAKAAYEKNMHDGSLGGTAIPTDKDIEAFQIIENGETIARTRDDGTTVTNDEGSYIEGLKAIEVPESATQEEKDRAVVDWTEQYIEDKLSDTVSGDGEKIAFDYKKKAKQAGRAVSFWKIRNDYPDLQYNEEVGPAGDSNFPRRGWEDRFVSYDACEVAITKFDSLNIRKGLGPGHVDPDLVAATIRNEQKYYKQTVDTGVDNYIRVHGNLDILDEFYSIGPAQLQIRNVNRLLDKYPEQLGRYKDDPLRAAVNPGDAPYFVSAYFAEVVEGLESNQKPDHITSKTWQSMRGLWKEGEVNKALIYAYNPDPNQVEHIQEQLAIIHKKRQSKISK